VNYRCGTIHHAAQPIGKTEEQFEGWPHAGGLSVIMILAGIALIVLGVVYTCMGRAYARFHGWVNRADDPKGYWRAVASYLVVGAGLIGGWPLFHLALNDRVQRPASKCPDLN
jgi:H+/Cl- antiporter ClcA